MANRFYSPSEQFADSTGLPYAGGTLSFYASQTSTPLATYSDAALTIPNTNPVVLDSAGRAGNVFLQNLAYKVVLADVNGSQIWSDDPVYTSDYSTRAIFLSGAGSPNGQVAGTAGSAGIGASVYWDVTNNILYVCTTTGTASTAVWTAVNASTAAAVVPPPQGRLTLTSGTPVLNSDVTGATAVYYTPYNGNLFPIYNGSSYQPTTFSELQLTLTSSQVGGSFYDIFGFNASGVVTIGTGPAWSTLTPGSSARGTGAGTTQITRLNGLWVNSVSMTVRNSATTYTVAANQGTYLGTIFMDTSAGQVSCYTSYGQTRKWGVWNAYNRSRTTILIGDATASWTYGSATIRQTNAAVGNTGAIFFGLPEEVASVQTTQRTSTLGANGAARSGYGVNSTTVFSGAAGDLIEVNSTATPIAGTGYANGVVQPTLGLNNINMLESAAAANTSTFVGGQNSCQMAISFNS